jgi:streptogramin lyase
MPNSITMWTLPPVGSADLNCMTNQARAGAVYYGKTGVDIIGELVGTPGSDAPVREWPVPVAALTAGGQGALDSVAFGPNNSVWFALLFGNRLVRLDPAAGIFTAFGSPMIGLPSNIAVDGLGNIWFTGVNQTQTGYLQVVGALIGAEPDLTHVREPAIILWPLPAECSNPACIWPEADGSAAWFTVSSGITGATGAFLGRITTSTNTLDYWSPTAAADPIGTGLTGFRATNPSEIWFGSWVNDGVYRLNVAQGTFTQYLRSTTSAQPSALVADAAGDCWIANGSSPLSGIATTCQGTPASFSQTTIEVTPVSAPATLVQQTVAAIRYLPLTATTSTLSLSVDNCYNDVALPSSPFYLKGIGLSAGSHGLSLPVYFAGLTTQLGQIGCLI